MISNRLLQGCLEDFSDIVRLNMALYDCNGACIAGEEDEAPEAGVITTFCGSAADMQALGSRYLFKVGGQENEYVFISQRRQQGYLSHGSAGSETAGADFGDWL